MACVTKKTTFIILLLVILPTLMLLRLDYVDVGHFIRENGLFASSRPQAREAPPRGIGNQLQQLERVYNRNITIHTDLDPGNFTHCISDVTVSTGFYREVVITIQETYNNAPTSGGSSFRGESWSEWFQLCRSTDFFNGTYIVRCPLLSACTNITVHLMFVNFDAFMDKAKPLINRLVYSSMHCSEKPTMVHRIMNQAVGYIGSREMAALDKTRCSRVWTESKALGAGHWRVPGSNQSWQWYEQGCPLEPMLDSHACHCLNQYRSVTFLGASHIRYMMDFLLVACGIMPNANQKHQSISAKHFKYIKLLYVNNITAWVDKDISQKPISRKNGSDIIAINAGAWDIQYLLRNYSYNVAAQHLYQTFDKLVRSEKWANARIFWFTTVPTPRRLKHYRNNFYTAGWLDWLWPRLEALGVEIIDMFYMQLHHDNDEPKDCICHYLCLSNGKPPRKVMGNTGKTMMHVFLKRVCETSGRIIHPP